MKAPLGDYVIKEGHQRYSNLQIVLLFDKCRFNITIISLSQ